MFFVKINNTRIFVRPFRGSHVYRSFFKAKVGGDQTKASSGFAVVYDIKNYRRESIVKYIQKNGGAKEVLPLLS